VALVQSTRAKQQQLLSQPPAVELRQFQVLEQGWQSGFSAGRLGGSTQEFVIAAEGVFRDLDFRHGAQAPWGPQALVIAQGAMTDLTAAELTA
jgi:hypothetical protein